VRGRARTSVRVRRQALVWARPFTLSVDDVEDPHHPVVLVEQQMAVEDAPADEVREVRPKAHIGVPRDAFLNHILKHFARVYMPRQIILIVEI